MRGWMAGTMGLSWFLNNLIDELLCNVVLAQSAKNCKEFAISTYSVIVHLDSCSGALLQATDNCPLPANNGADAFLRDPELVVGRLSE